VGRLKKLLLRTLAVLVVIQLVPYGRAHVNPPVIQEPAWESAAIRERVRVSCFDCHSNQTTWPWYSHVAPTSWLLQYDVTEGRRHLNFSEFNAPQRHAKDAAEQLRSGEMPQSDYLLLHSAARLTDAQREQLAAAFERMFGK